MDVIYVDELWAINALTDYLLLTLTARLLGVPCRRGRFALAAALGGVYAAAAVLPALGWLRAPGIKLAASLWLCWMAFGSGEIWRSWAAFLALSAGFAGTVLAAVMLSGQRPAPGGVIAGASLRLLGLCYGICLAGVQGFLSGVARRREGRILRVELSLAGRRATLSALRDTGNALTDPVSARPVLIADADALSPLLGGPVPRELLADPSALFSFLSARPELVSRLGLVSYAAVGGGGLLVCVRPDEALVDGRDTRLLAALSPTPLRARGCQAVF